MQEKIIKLLEALEGLHRTSNVKVETQAMRHADNILWKVIYHVNGESTHTEYCNSLDAAFEGVFAKLTDTLKAKAHYLEEDLEKLQRVLKAIKK